MKHTMVIVVAALLGSAPVAFAQTQPAPAASPAPAAKPTPAAKPATAAPAKPAAAAPMDKTAKAAKSKECSAQADQKGLHGKARKTFREECKKM